jgi:hypothetical protein
MIRQTKTSDINNIASYLSSKLKISFLEANIKAKKIVKSGLPSFIIEEKDLTGICYVESKSINSQKYIEILVNNWRLAEDFIQILRWNLDGIYYLSLPKHDMLNRTFNKNGIRFLKCEGDKNIYCYKFEKRQFFNHKSEDIS